jgi:hypothetical protein
MATPNIINTSTVNGNLVVLAANTVGMSNVVVNSVGSNQLIKINTITIANYNSSSVSVNVDVFRNGVGYYINGNIVVPAQSMLTGLSKDSSIYLNEGDSLRANVSVNNSIHITVSYDVYS